MKYKLLTSLALIFIFISVSYLQANQASMILKLSYDKTATDVFKGRISATGLKPNHEYVFTLNGWADHKSNEILAKEGKYWKPTGEGFYDFKKVITDSKGSFNENIEELLPKGIYKVKFLVKDTANWIVIWSDDTVKFKVK